MSATRRFDVGWLATLLVCVFAVAPLCAPGFFLKAHDATIGAYFLSQFHEGIADGALYPRWAMDWTYGYGYPLFVVIAPLAFYVAELFHLLGAGIVAALKITYALSFFFSGLSMYLFGRELFGRAGGVVSAALYVYAPYHLVDIYVRADLAEFASFALFPAILWAILRLSRAENRSDVLRYVALGALLYGMLILTHITMAMVFTPVAVLYALMLAAGQRERVWPLMRVRLLLAQLGVFALGGAIGAAYLLPGFLEQRYLRAQDLVGGYYGYANHYVYPSQMLSPFWGYGYAAIGPGDQMPYQLGVAAVVLALCALWALPRMASDVRRQTAFFLAVSALVIFAMLSASQPLWDLFRPVVAFVQFPWRLLSLSALCLAPLGGALVAARDGEAYEEGRRVAALLVVLVLLASYTYVAPQYTDSGVSLKSMIQFQLDTKELLGDTIWVTEKPTGSPMMAEYLAEQPPTRAAAGDPQAGITVLHRGGASYEVAVTAPAATDVVFQIRYFPGWKAYVDGKLAATEIRAPQGLMAVAVPAGEHTVLLRFEDTPLRLVSKLITLVGLAVAGLLLVMSRRRAATSLSA